LSTAAQRAPGEAAGNTAATVNSLLERARVDRQQGRAADAVADAHRALAIADGIRHYGERMDFFADYLLGDDPDGVKAGLRTAYSRLLDREFDSLLFAHGDPIVGGGKEALRRFAEGA